MVDYSNQSIDDVLYQVEVNLILSGVASIDADWVENPESECRRWAIPEGSQLRSMISSSVIEADGLDEYKLICSEAAATKNPFLAFRQRMSREAMERLNAKLVNLAVLRSH